MRDEFNATVESPAFVIPPAGPCEPEPEGVGLRIGGATFAICLPLATFDRGSAVA
jgi:hypothetical protein